MHINIFLVAKYFQTPTKLKDVGRFDTIFYVGFSENLPHDEAVKDGAEVSKVIWSDPESVLVQIRLKRSGSPHLKSTNYEEFWTSRDSTISEIFPLRGQREVAEHTCPIRLTCQTGQCSFILKMSFIRMCQTWTEVIQTRYLSHKIFQTFSQS